MENDGLAYDARLFAIPRDTLGTHQQHISNADDARLLAVPNFSFRVQGLVVGFRVWSLGQ